MSIPRIIIVFFLVFVLVMVAQPAAAADDTDLFESMEEESSSEDDLLLLEEEGEEEKGKDDKFKVLTQLGENASGSVRLRCYYFMRGAEERDGADTNDFFVDYILKFESNTEIDNWRLDIAGWAEGGSQDHTYGGISKWFQDKERDRRRHLEINELYLTQSSEDSDITIGKKIFTNGISTLFSPADRFRPQDFHDPMDPKDIGIFQTRIDYYFDRHTFTAAIMPVFTTGKNPHDSSRWIGSSREEDENRDYDMNDESDVEEEYPDIKGRNVGFFGRAKTTYKGYDLFFSAYTGPNPYYVLKEETRDGQTVKIKKTVGIGNYAAGFSTTYKKWEFHSEALFNWSYSGKDDNYFSYVGGTTYTIDDWAKSVFLEQIVITVEYGGEYKTRDQHAPNYVKSSRNNRAGRNDIYSRVNFKYNEDLSFQYVSNYEFSDRGRYNKFASKYRLKEGLTWRAAIEAFNGPDDSYYGRWWRNDRITTSLEYKF